MVPSPSHYWDFSQVSNVNGITYVFDQMTKDDKFSFSNQPGRVGLCDKNTKQESPIFGPEGAYIYSEQSSMRLENANNIMMGNKFTIALWVKIHPIWKFQQGNLNLVAQKRFDDDFFPTYALGIRKISFLSIILGGYREQPSDPFEGLFNFRSQITSTATNVSDGHGLYKKGNITLGSGWFLIIASIDSTTSKLQKSMKIRGPNGKYDNLINTLDGYVYNELLYQPSKSDIYVGGHCSQDGTTLGQPATISRLYIWKNYAETTNTINFDRFFFRNNGLYTQNEDKILMPICKGSVPCSFCVVGYSEFNLPIKGGVIKCTSNNEDQSKYMFVDWDFDHPSNTQTSQYVIDQSGNNNHLAKSPVDDVESSEFLRIIGQGLLWYKQGAGIYARTVQLVNIGQNQQFTAEVWFRIIDKLAPGPGKANTAIPIQVTDKNGIETIQWTLSEQTKKSVICFGNGCEWRSEMILPDDQLNNDKWHFASLGMVSYRLLQGNQGMGTSVRHQVDTLVEIDTKISEKDQSGFQIPQDGQFFVKAQKEVIFRRIKIYNFIKYEDEVSLMYSTATNCKTIGNQDQCDICPSDTNKCLSVCKEDEYGDNCDKCHNFCGHCTGPSKNDCVYCARNVTPSNVFYSQTFGNCSCVAGYYYNSTTDKCEACHSLCEECFGAGNDKCLTCKTGKMYTPYSICTEDCKDPLVVGNTNLAFYPDTATTPNVCLECHHFCAECNGSYNNNCSKCQEGYYLSNGYTCLATCPDGLYPDETSHECKACHGDCITCSEGSNNNCITCTNPLKLQQNGKCQLKCDEGFFPNDKKVCVGCHESCQTCTTPSQNDCQSCSNGYYLEWLSTTCNSTCKSGTFADSNTNTCQMCHYSCATCSGGSPDQCTKCSPGFLKRGSFCVTQCSNFEYEVGGLCMTCDPKCQTCYGIQDNQCYSCAENTLTGIGYFYFNDSCLETCPDGYYPDNLRRICRKCNPRCATCISESFCTSCVYGPYQLNNGECTFFTCLDSQYRTLKPNLACYECDPTCLTCQGQSKFDCLTCKSQYQFSAQQCLSCSQQPGMTDPIDDTPGCVEICGDGFNYGSYQCDDGNLINGDGCSSNCRIEQGFNCTTGSKLAPSVCMDNKNPTPKISLVSAKNNIYIEFDEEVQLQKVLDEYTVKISVSGSQALYKFDWRLADEYKTSEPTQMAIIELSFYSSLKGEGKEQVIIQFLTDQVYKDATGNGILTLPLYANLNKFDYIDPETKAKLEAAGDTSMFATFGAVAINLVIFQLFGGSIAAMWTMVNTIQLISLLPLCNINYPQITVMVIQKMLSSHGESTTIPNVFYDFIVNRQDSKVKIEQAFNNRFRDYGWEISNFLYLSGRKILLWTLIIFAYPFVWYMKSKYADKHKICRFWVKTEQKFRYTMLLRGVIMSYVSMYLAFVLGIFKMDLTTMENTISAFFAIAFGIILTYLPMQLMNILQRNYERINSEKFMLAYSTIIKEVDLSHPIKYMYYPVFLIRRALFAIQLVLFANNPVQQIGFMSATAFVMILYVVIIKPQKEKVMIIQTAFGEGLMLALHLFSIVFLDEDLPEEKSNTYGWLMLCMIGLYILTNWIVIITITVKQLKGKYRDYKQNKVESKKKVKEDLEYKRWKKKRHIKYIIDKEYQKQQILEKYEEVMNLRQQREAMKMFNDANNNNNNNSNYQQLPHFNVDSPNRINEFNSPDFYNRLTQKSKSQFEVYSPFTNDFPFTVNEMTNRNLINNGNDNNQNNGYLSSGIFYNSQYSQEQIFTKQNPALNNGKNQQIYNRSTFTNYFHGIVQQNDTFNSLQKQLESDLNENND